MVIVDLTVPRYSDAILVIEMSPPEPIGGQNIELVVQKRVAPDSSGLIRKSVASGYNAVSGIEITNSGIGVMQITLNASDTSGLDSGNYEFICNRLDSGLSTALSMGGFILLPR